MHSKNKQNETISQDLIIEKMKYIGYSNIYSEGVCHGISHMEIQAILIGQQDEFEKRIRLVVMTDKEELKEKIEAAKNRVKKGEALTEADREFLEVLSFFDGIMLYQHGDIASKWFSEHITWSEPLKVASFVQSPALENEGGIFEVYAGLGIYTEKELSFYLKKLSDELKKLENCENIAMRITNVGHSMLLTYDSEKDKWNLFDPNQIFKEPISPEEIAKEIMLAFSENTMTAFETRIYTTKKYADKHNVLKKLKSLNDIEELKIDDIKIKRKTDREAFILILAANDGQLNVIKEILEKDPSQVDLQYKDRWTALHFAVEGGDLDIVKVLLDKGAKVDAKIASNGSTALHLAVANGHLNLVKMLLDKNASVNELNEVNLTPLHLAMQKNYPEIVAVLLEKDPSIINLKTKDGWMVLHWAISKDHLDIAKMLLDKGASAGEAREIRWKAFQFAVQQNCLKTVKALLNDDTLMNISAENRWIALQQAIKLGHREIIAALIEKNVSIVSKDSSDAVIKGINARNEQGETALMIAIKEGNLEIIKFLLENYKDKIDTNTKNNKGEPILMLIFNNHRIPPSFVKLLIDNGALADARDKDGLTILHHAARGNRLNIVKELLEKDASLLKITDPIGWTALHYAARSGRINIVKELLEKDASLLKITDTSGWTALHCATKQGYCIDVVEALLEKDLSLMNSKTIDGWMALHMAASDGLVDVAKALLAKDTTLINTKINDGWTALMLAAETGKLEMVKLLIEHGASVDVVNNEGKTALELAQDAGHNEIVNFITTSEKSKSSILHQYQMDPLKASKTNKGVNDQDSSHKLR